MIESKIIDGKITAREITKRRKKERGEETQMNQESVEVVRERERERESYVLENN